MNEWQSELLYEGLYSWLAFLYIFQFRSWRDRAEYGGNMVPSGNGTDYNGHLLRQYSSLVLKAGLTFFLKTFIVSKWLVDKVIADKKLCKHRLWCQQEVSKNVNHAFEEETLTKAWWTRGLSSYHKFVHKSWSNFNFRISNLSINFKISNKHQYLN